MNLTIACVFRNEDQLLKEILDQVVKIQPFEAIFVDDFSTDNSYELVKSYQGKANIKLFQNEMKGFGQQRNFVLDLAKGDYVLWYDSDDLYYPLRDLMRLLGSIDSLNGYLCYAFRRPTVIDDMHHIGTDPSRLIAIGGLHKNIPEIRFTPNSHPGLWYSLDPEFIKTGNPRVFHWMGTPEYVKYIQNVIIFHRHYLLADEVIDNKSKGNDRFLKESAKAGVRSFHSIHLHQKRVAELSKRPRTDIEGVDFSQEE